MTPPWTDVRFRSGSVMSILSPDVNELLRVWEAATVGPRSPFLEVEWQPPGQGSPRWVTVDLRAIEAVYAIERPTWQ